MGKRHVCPNCGSDDCDVVKTKTLKLPKGAEGSSPNAWPFPTSLRPQKHGLPKYNPNNEEEAPI